ncbi:hypothetical protein [Halodesulfovibrio aestuarii]|uniref:Uncharacterized protein n=1 Tax=Halodesulfovibrio aestuarii TaxID=126333 RepID=A0ABV4JTJ4_9BACT
MLKFYNTMYDLGAGTNVDNLVQAEEITIGALHGGIENALREAFPTVTVCDYDALMQEQASGSNELNLPALVLSLASFENDVPTATEELAIKLRWELRVVCSQSVQKADLNVRELAARVSTFIHNNQFGCKIMGAKFVAAKEYQLAPEFTGLNAWIVTFEQSVCLGESCFKGEFQTPQKAYASMAPEIGLAYIDKYTSVEEVIHELPAS